MDATTSTQALNLGLPFCLPLTADDGIDVDLSAALLGASTSSDIPLPTTSTPGMAAWNTMAILGT